MKISLHSVFVSLLFATTPLYSLAEETTPADDSADSATKTEEATKIIRYVNDHLVITIRSGSSKRDKVVKSVPSGTWLEVLATKGKYSRVRTLKGKEGWVLSRYLTDEPVAKQQLKEARKQLEKLKANNSQLSKKLQAVTQKHGSLTRENNKIAEKNSNLSSQLEKTRDVASKPIELHEQNRGLLESKVKIESENEMLKQEVQVLRDQSNKHWFLAGAGVLLVGTFLGLIIPKMRRRRKSDWGSL